MQTATKIGWLKYATTMRLETQSGTRAQSEQARDIQQLKGIRPAGFFAGVQPMERQEHVTDSQGRKIEFPLSAQLCASLTSSITMNPGTSQLVWMCREPEAADD